MATHVDVDARSARRRFVEALAPERFQRKIVKFLDQNGGTTLERADDRKQAKWMQACADKGFLFAMVFHRCVDGCCCVWRLCLAVSLFMAICPCLYPCRRPCLWLSIMCGCCCVEFAAAFAFVSGRVSVYGSLFLSLSMAVCPCRRPRLWSSLSLFLSGAICVCLSARSHSLRGCVAVKIVVGYSKWTFLMRGYLSILRRVRLQ